MVFYRTFVRLIPFYSCGNACMPFQNILSPLYVETGLRRSTTPVTSHKNSGRLKSCGLDTWWPLSVQEERCCFHSNSDSQFPAWHKSQKIISLLDTTKIVFNQHQVPSSSNLDHAVKAITTAWVFTGIFTSPSCSPRAVSGKTGKFHEISSISSIHCSMLKKIQLRTSPIF